MWLLVFLLAFLWDLAIADTQRIFEASSLTHIDNSTAPFIFNSVSSLLVQWPNTLHQTGHSIIPGILEPFTLLYHARKDSLLPAASEPEWFAFDPEMSYAIMVPRGGETFMLTYRSMRPAKVLYFDGMSAALGEGWLDTQQVIITGSGKQGNESIFFWWDDYGRARKLCEWAESRDVEGFVRMNAGFEVLWCDFSSPSLQLVSQLNITPPLTPEGQWPPQVPHASAKFDLEDLPPPSSMDDFPEPGPGEPGRQIPGRPNRPPGGPGRRFPRRPETSPLSRSGYLEWLRSATRHSMAPQSHIQLSYSGMVTYYDPRLSSLMTTRSGPMRSHRIWTNVSTEDVRTVLDDVDEVLIREKSGFSGSGMDWGSTARDIIDYWGDRIPQMQSLLVNATSTTINMTEALSDIRLLSYSPLNPYMDSGSLFNASGWELFFGSSSYDAHLIVYAPELNFTGTAFDRCVYQTTGFLSYPYTQVRMTPQERLLKTSVETVLQRLCETFGIIFAESSDLDDQDVLDLQLAQRRVGQWNSQVDDLKAWLDWAVWLRCEQVCSEDSVCSMPLWPINAILGWRREGGNSDERNWKPRCTSLVL